VRGTEYYVITLSYTHSQRRREYRNSGNVGNSWPVSGGMESCENNNNSATSLLPLFSESAYCFMSYPVTNAVTVTLSCHFDATSRFGESSFFHFQG
jgi:hypothetical protein